MGARVTLSIVLSYTYNFSFILLLGTFGILTSIFSRIFATFWLDLKKVVAFSTTSQLRLICFSIVLFNFRLIIFHIIFHAFSKAIIFISTGLVLHTFNSSQDSRKISNFINFSINSFKLFLILGSFSLIRVFISFNLFILNFNFSLFNSFIRKFLPIILLAFILPKVLSFNFNHLSFNIFNISNFHLKISNKF